MWGPVTTLPPRLWVSAVAGSCRRRRWETSPRCPARPLRRLSGSCVEPLAFGNLVPAAASPRGARGERLFPGSATVADTVVRLLEAEPRGTGPLVLECNPGPGLITCALLNAGIRVVALESDQAFLPHLTTLKNHMDGQLEVIHCDFFFRDPSGDKTVTSSMYTDSLFKNLGISEVPWKADVPVKVVGFFPTKNERSILWKLLYDLYSCSSIYNYGRIELNMFISEKEYKKIISLPGKKFYQPLSVLWQTACEIKLLHTEPLSSFVTLKNSAQKSSKSVESENKCLNFIRLTPRRNLFTDHLTPANSFNFIYLVKQCFRKRNMKLIDIFNSWSICDAQDLLQQLKKEEDDPLGSLHPEEFKYLFEAMEHSETFTSKWLFDYLLQNTVPSSS